MAEGTYERRKATIGAKLRARRQELALTQWDIARELGYSTAQFISNWERGVSFPPDEAVPVLAGALNYGPAELMNMIYDRKAEELELLRTEALKGLPKRRKTA